MHFLNVQFLEKMYLKIKGNFFLRALITFALIFILLQIISLNISKQNGKCNLDSEIVIVAFLTNYFEQNLLIKHFRINLKIPLKSQK